MKKATFVYATFIRTTPEKLWEALTSGDFSLGVTRNTDPSASLTPHAVWL